MLPFIFTSAVEYEEYKSIQLNRNNIICVVWLKGIKVTFYYLRYGDISNMSGVIYYNDEATLFGYPSRKLFSDDVVKRVEKCKGRPKNSILDEINDGFELFVSIIKMIHNEDNYSYDKFKQREVEYGRLYGSIKYLDGYLIINLINDVMLKYKIDIPNNEIERYLLFVNHVIGDIIANYEPITLIKKSEKQT